MASEKKVSLLLIGGGWITNTGNAFLDLGFKHMMKNVFEDFEIYILSNTQKWIFDKISSGLLLKNIKNRIRSGIFEAQKNISCDFVAIHGACLGVDWIKLHGDKVSSLVERGTKLLIIGASMTSGTYKCKEYIQSTKDFLKRLNPYIFISRDEITFQTFRDIAEYSYNGIDCAFFVNNAFTPPKLDYPDYVILNFDKSKEPDVKMLEIDKNVKIVRAHHSFWFNFKTSWYFYIMKNVLISDIPYDYLTIYANTYATYSDRVHACVATLAYGNAARLFTDNPRSLLFDRIGLNEITKKLVYANESSLQEEKKKQIQFLKSVMNIR